MMAKTEGREKTTTRGRSAWTRLDLVARKRRKEERLTHSGLAVSSSL